MSGQYIRDIDITAYRNIEKADVTFSPEINIIYGENAQGKTNFMEAVWLMSGGKSFRGTKDRDMIGFGSDAFRIEGTVVNELEEVKITVACAKNNPKYTGRMAKINNGSFVSPSKIVGNFYRVIFSPVHLNIISGGPALRRKFADACLCQMYPGFMENYRQYVHVIDQRNNFLKNIKKYDEQRQSAVFDTMDSTLAGLGYEIYRQRDEFINLLAEYAGSYYDKISHGREKLTFVYRHMGKTREEILEKLINSRERDKVLGYTTVGIHREDIDIYLDGKKAGEYASQGQQRSVVIAMKLAESDIMQQVTGVAPAVLLDDVLSELDSARQDYLLNNIKGRQVFITSCHIERIQMSGSRKFYVENGTVTEKH